jgi:hypothetical protein
MKIRNIIFFITALFFTGSVFALPALAPVFASIGTAVVASLGITATVATGTLIAIGVATVVVGAYAGSQLLGAMSMDFPDNMSAQARSALANQQGSTNPLPVIYGKRRVGGTPIFYHVSGADNEFLHVVYAIAEGEIQGVSQVYLNNDEVNTTPDLYDTSLTSIVVGEGETAGVFGGITSFGTENIHKPKYEGIVKYEIYNGTTTQTADQDLISETNGTWTSSDRLQGVAYAIVRFKFEPEVFGNTGIPQVNFDVIGKKTRSTTSGGTTYKVFSDNPADCIEDYLTNTIYGRSIPTSQIDSTSFTTARNICDTEVTVGDKTQKKYTCNGILNTNNKALDNIEKLLTSCRGSLIFSGGKYKLLIDDTGTAVQTFDEDNIVGAFELALGGKEYKANKIRANFFNRTRDMQGDFAIVESSTFKTEDNGLSLERAIELPFTDQMERAQMISTINMKQSRQSLVFKFTSTIVGLRAEIGDVVFISLESLGWNTLNSNQGKKFKIMKLAIKNNDEVDITAREYDDDVYDFGLIQAEDTSPNTSLPNFSFVDKPAISTPSEELIAIPPTLFNRVTINWTQPNKSSVESYEIGINRLNSVRFANKPSYDFEGRSVTESFTIDKLEEGQYFVAVRAKNRLGVYSDFATEIFEVKNFSTLPAVNTPAINFVTEELFTTTQGSGVKAKAILTFGTSVNTEWEDLGVTIDHYDVEFKKSTEASFQGAGTSQGTNFEFFDIEPALYEFRVRAVNTVGVASEFSSTTQRIYGLTAVPSDVSNLFLRADSNTATLSWTPTTDLDVKIGGFYEIRHNSLTSGAVWAQSTQVGEAVSGIANSTEVPLLVSTYLIKAVDSTGVKSANATTVVNTVTPDLFQSQVFLTRTENPSFSGTKSNMVVTDDNTLKLEADTLFDSLGLIDEVGLIDAAGGVDLSGTYDFANIIDTGISAQSYRLSSAFAFTTNSTSDFIDTRSGNVDDYESIDLNTYDDVEVQLQIATTNDDPSGSPTFTDFQNFRIGNYHGRAFKFRLLVTSGDVTHQVYISSLSATLEAFQKIDTQQLTSSTSALGVTFGEGFLVTPKIAVTAQNMASGDFYEITSVSSTGFTITFKNSSGTIVARTFDYIARGF